MPRMMVKAIQGYATQRRGHRQSRRRAESGFASGHVL